MLECIQPRFRHAVCGIATAESGETRSGSPLLDEVTAGAVYVGREGRQCDTHWSQRSAVDGRPRLDGGQPAVFHLWRRKTGRGARYVGMDLKTSATRWNVYPRCFLFLVPFPASQLCTSTTTSFFLDSLTLCHLLCSHSLSGNWSATARSRARGKVRATRTSRKKAGLAFNLTRGTSTAAQTLVCQTRANGTTAPLWCQPACFDRHNHDTQFSLRRTHSHCPPTHQQAQ